MPHEFFDHTGKKNLRFWREAAIEVGKSDAQHELVHERRELIDRLLAGEDVDVVLCDAIACLVSKEEHRRLATAGGRGWQRYKSAAIKVYDVSLRKWVAV